MMSYLKTSILSPEPFKGLINNEYLIAGFHQKWRPAYFFALFQKYFSVAVDFHPSEIPNTMKGFFTRNGETTSPFLENRIYRSAGTLLYDEPRRGYAKTPFHGRARNPTETTNLPLVGRRPHTRYYDTSLRSWRRTRQRREPMSSVSNRTPVDFP